MKRLRRFLGSAAGVNLDIADYIEPSMEKWLMITDMMYMCTIGSGEMEISAIEWSMVYNTVPAEGVMLSDDAE